MHKRDADCTFGSSTRAAHANGDLMAGECWEDQEFIDAISDADVK
jgi:hypothetical protein